jgi:SAM-dependent methyltransferase
MTRRVAVFALTAVLLAAQIPSFNFYPEFRRWWFALPAEQRRPLDAVIDRYQQRLGSEGVSADEIARRVNLIRTRRQELENDFWDRYFTTDKPEFNTAPNSFLVSVLDHRRPGRALDVGMGEGRNTLYLAKQGWDVSGFDPAAKAVALAEKRANELGLKIHTQVALDKDFDFGHEQWDLILLSWMPVNDSARIVSALRPGGVLVFEGPEAWFPPNGLLKDFAALRVVHYEDKVRQADFFERKEIPVVRLLAEKQSRVALLRRYVPACSTRLPCSSLRP